MSAEIPASDAERLKRQAQAAIREQVVPAYRKFLGFFDREYFPACLDDIGALRLPNGQEFYAHLARKHTTTSLTPNEIHDIGQSEVRRIRSEMEKIREKVAFQGTLAEFFEHLRTAPQYRYTDANDLLTAYQAFSKRVDPLLPPLFRKLPRIPYGVEAIPEHMAPDTTTAYYRPPAADGTRAGTYFVNLYKPEKRPKYEIAALSLHEAVPGHHLQIALATELENVPEFRKHTHFTAYIEGWALYAESLGDEMHLYDDPYSKMGQLTYEMWRAIRLVVDTGMHSKGWSRDQAIQFFKDNSPKDELDITNEIDRYIAWPGQALAYKIGELKIKELRARAKTKLGARFDIREFHDVILREGALPLDVLEKNVDAWLEGKQ
jgi:prolyl oligopeptidase